MEITTTTILALFTTLILVGQLLISFFIGADSDIDVDGDSSGDFDVSTIFSPKGILHFVCGSSWYLVSLGKTVYSFSDYAISGCIGLLFTLIMVGVYWLMFKLQKEIIPEKEQDLVGRSGSIYQKIDDKGNYIINIEINGALRELGVRAEDINSDYKPLEKVSIKKYENNIYYI